MSHDDHVMSELQKEKENYKAVTTFIHVEQTPLCILPVGVGP